MSEVERTRVLYVRTTGEEISPMYNGRRCWDEDRSNGSQRRSREATDFNTREVVASRLLERGRSSRAARFRTKSGPRVPRNVFQVRLKYEVRVSRVDPANYELTDVSVRELSRFLVHSARSRNGLVINTLINT